MHGPVWRDSGVSSAKAQFVQRGTAAPAVEESRVDRGGSGSGGARSGRACEGGIGGLVTADFVGPRGLAHDGHALVGQQRHQLLGEEHPADAGCLSGGMVRAAALDDLADVLGPEPAGRNFVQQPADDRRVRRQARAVVLGGFRGGPGARAGGAVTTQRNCSGMKSRISLDSPLPPATLIHRKGGCSVWPEREASSWILTNRAPKSLSLLTTAMWLATPVVKSATASATMAMSFGKSPRVRFDLRGEFRRFTWRLFVGPH